MPDDLAMLAEPRVVLVAWASGLALVSGLVALARLVGPGFTWVAGAVAGLVGLSGAFGDETWWVRVGLLLIGIGLILARNRRLSGLFQIAAGVAFLIEAGQLGGWVPALSGTIALGGVSGEMLLGHWYLVDPRLPRWALKALAGAGIVGLASDSMVLAAAGLPGGAGTVAFIVLMATSVVLMGAVLASLRYPAYAGVMAATGLSYLAVLTTLGGVFLGRVLVAGGGLFAN